MKALTICAVVLVLASCAAAQVPTIHGTVGSVSASPDSYVQVPVTISMTEQSNPITDGTVILQVLDSNGQLSQTAKIVKVEAGPVLPGQGLNFGTNPPEVYPGDPLYDPNYPGTSSVMATFFYFDQKPIGSGTLLNVTLKTHGTQPGDQFTLKLATFQLTDSTVMPPLDYNCVPHDGALAIASQIVVAPQSAVVRAGRGLQFTATVFGLTPSTVRWEVVGGAANGTVGPEITDSGQAVSYVAPAVVDVQRVVFLKATSLADPTKQAQATITLKPAIKVTVQPAVATVRQGNTIQFTATVENVEPGQEGVAWSIDPAIGSIDSNGLYTPPTAPIPDGQQQTVTVRATNVTEGITTVGTAALTVKPAVRVQITGPSGILQAGKIKRKQTVTFTGTAVNADNPAVTWSASAGTMNPNTGQYTAPDTVPSPPTVTITATSVEDPSKSAQVVLEVKPGAVQVSPASATVTLGHQLPTPFTATVDGVSAQVSWSVDFGTITQAGVYTAPTQMPAGGQATVTATDPDTGLTGTAVVSLQDVTIALTPDAGINTIRGGRSFTITAAVGGTDDKRVTWTAVNKATGQPFGSITATTDGQPATYTAPPIGSFAVPVEVRVTATTRDLGRSTTLDFTVRPGIAVAVSGPAKTNVDRPGVQFSAVVSGIGAGEDPGVVWSVASGGGTIDANGLYVPTGVTPPRDVVVKATSRQAISEVGAGSAEYGTGTIQVLPPVSTVITIQEGRSFVARGGQLHFTAVVSNFVNTGAVTWSVAPVNPGDDPGTISQNGVYTAPAQVTYDYQVVVSATPVDDPRPGHGASVTITVKQVEVVVTAERNNVRVGKSVGLQATASGVDSPVFTWEIVRGGGSLSATTGSQVVYTAPSTVPTPPEAEIRATVQGVSHSVVLEIRGRVTVTLTPAQTSARVGGNNVVLTAALGNWRAGDPPIVWKVNGLVGGNGTVGTVSQDGVYSPPAALPTPSVVTVSAESPEDPTWKGTAVVTLKPRPRVTGISPAVAAGRGSLEIFGSDFGSAGTVQIGGSNAGIVVESWTDTRIRVTQPGNLSGGVKVTVDGSASNDDIQFRIVAGIAAIEVTPPSAVVRLGDQVRFSAVAKDASGSVMTEVTFAWSASPDPSEPGAGTISQDGLFTAAGVGRVTITASPLGREGEHKVGTASVLIAEAPRVVGVLPAAGPVGAEVRVVGANFGSTQGDSVLTIGGVPAQVKSWSSTEIKAVVADGTKSGPVVVTAAGTRSNDTVLFTVLTSVSVTPASAEVPEGTTAVFSAVGIDAEGNSVPGLTFEWKVEPAAQDGGQAAIDALGNLKALKAGTVQVAASYLGLTAQAVVTIIPERGEEAPIFAFMPPALYSTGEGTSPNWLVLSDVTGDGASDVLTTSRLRGELILLPGGRSGSFGNPVVSAIGGAPAGVVPYDVDSTGRGDAAVADLGESKVKLLVQGPDGLFKVTKTLPETADGAVGGTYDLTVGDFNGDGLADLAAVDMFVGNRARLFLRRSDGTYQVEAYPVGRLPVSLSAADFNGDGRSDLAVTTLYPGTLVILLTDGAGRPGSRFGTPLKMPVGMLAYSVTAGDVDGDGDADIVVADPASNQVAVVANAGPGQFLPPVTYPVGKAPRAVTVGDFNMDGKPDLAVANEGSQSISILPGDGTAGRRFGLGTEVSVGGSPTDVAAGDLNGDGKPDLVALLSSTSKVSVLLNAYSPPVVAEPDLRMVAPITGEVIEGTTLRVRVAVSNFRLVDFRTKPSNAPGEGHIHMWLDADPKDPKAAREVTTYEDTVFVGLPYGEHTLTVALCNNDHSPLSPPVVRTVRFVTVPSTRK